MEAIKPGSSKEIIKRSQNEEDDDQPYEPVDTYAYAINTQPPPAPKKTEQTQKETVDYRQDSVNDDHLYDDPECFNDNRPQMHLPQPPPPTLPTQAISSEPPPILPLLQDHDQYIDLHDQGDSLYEDLPVDQLPPTSAPPSTVPLPPAVSMQLHDEEEGIYEEYDDAYDFSPPPLPQPLQGGIISPHPMFPPPHKSPPSSSIKEPMSQPLPPLPKRPPTQKFSPQPKTPPIKEPMSQTLPAPPPPPLKPPSSSSGEDPTLQQVLQEKCPPLSSVKKSVTIPRDLSSFSELSLENISSLTPGEVQIWMLLQMQKMVQKMEDVYETTPEALTPRLAAKQPVPPPPQAVKDDSAHHQTTQRQVFYANMDDLEEALSDAPPPPLPPRTYKCQTSVEGEELEKGAHEYYQQKPVPRDEGRLNTTSFPNVYSQQPDSKSHKLITKL